MMPDGAARLLSGLPESGTIFFDLWRHSPLLIPGQITEFCNGKYKYPYFGESMRSAGKYFT
jgi:hypothetical protein